MRIIIFLLLIQCLAAANLIAGESRPKVWIITDMSDPSLRGGERGGSVNDPDDVSAMAGYLLMANEFDTRGIVVASTHRNEHRATPNQADWADKFFGDAYRAEVSSRNDAIGGYPANVEFTESCIKESGERYDPDRSYSSLSGYVTVAALINQAESLQEGQRINVLCWGSLTEPAILVKHCLSNRRQDLLGKLRFIAHWTNSSLHQGTAEHPNAVANCREDANACAYLKECARMGMIAYHECGAIGQHGIVSGGPKGEKYFVPFHASRLGKIFAEGKFVYKGVDHSDSATYWVLLHGYGVDLEDVAADGTNPPAAERANEESFRKTSRAIHDELLRRSNAALPRASAEPGTASEKLGLRFSGNISWNSSSATLVFLSSGAMPNHREGFYWNVPNEVRRIVIQSDVTVTGAFRIPYRSNDNPLTIVGKDRETSVIYGTNESAWTTKNRIPDNDKWRYGAINVLSDAVVHVKNLTSANPRGYNISGYANQSIIHVDRCDLVDRREGDSNNSDGFIGSAGSSIRNSLISTSDDAIKVYHDITIENVTIEQHRNGAALQFGWGGENNDATATITNLTIRGVEPDGHYNMAPLTWEGGQHGRRRVKINGLVVQIQGQIYDEQHGNWQPIGLLELKPSGCQFDMEVTNGKLNGIAPGIRRTPGTVTINGNSIGPGGK